MSTLIVVFNVASGAAVPPQLLQVLKRQPKWARLTPTCFLVQTAETVVTLRDELIKAVGPDDTVFVGTCPVPSAWHAMPGNVSKWILENQPDPKA
jgi:hypothetical protein